MEVELQHKSDSTASAPAAAASQSVDPPFDDSDSDPNRPRSVVVVPSGDVRVGLSSEELIRKRKLDRERRKQEATKRGILKRKQLSDAHAHAIAHPNAQHQQQMQAQSAAIAAALNDNNTTHTAGASASASSGDALRNSSSVQRAISQKKVRKLLAADGSVRTSDDPHPNGTPSPSNARGSGGGGGGRLRSPSAGSSDDPADDRAPTSLPSFELDIDQKIRSLDQNARIRMLYACAFTVALVGIALTVVSAMTLSTAYASPKLHYSVFAAGIGMWFVAIFGCLAANRISDGMLIAFAGMNMFLSFILLIMGIIGLTLDIGSVGAAVRSYWAAPTEKDENGLPRLPIDIDAKIHTANKDLWLVGIAAVVSAALLFGAAAVVNKARHILLAELEEASQEQEALTTFQTRAQQRRLMALEHERSNSTSSTGGDVRLDIDHRRAMHPLVSGAAAPGTASSASSAASTPPIHPSHAGATAPAIPSIPLVPVPVTVTPSGMVIAPARDIGMMGPALSSPTHRQAAVAAAHLSSSFMPYSADSDYTLSDQNFQRSTQRHEQQHALLLAATGGAAHAHARDSADHKSDATPAPSAAPATASVAAWTSAVQQATASANATAGAGGVSGPP